jgi:crotonobetainyl-CoA:carnitine CoA-transferase CaiB-like acyl-CoA transferase
MRTLDFANAPRVGLFGENASLFYAEHWLNQIGVGAASAEALPDPGVVIVGGDRLSASGVEHAIELAPTVVFLWDFQKDRAGDGLHASAAAGVSFVLGFPDTPPLALPFDMPEKWCGLVGANLALSALLEKSLQGSTGTRRFDASAADVLRSLADQNSGNETDIDADWRRNGRTAVDHGGIFPQGFFACADGHVAIIGRSKKDWAAIRDVIGRPDWADDEKYEDPFALAFDVGDAEEKLTEALERFNRDELLERAIQFGATLAPVFEAVELKDRGIVRPGFFKEDGGVSLPFEIFSRQS